MFTETEERHIKELFEQERCADRRLTPSFQSVLQSPRKTGSGWLPLARPLGVAAALTVLLVVSGLFLADRSDPPVPVTAESASYLYWESPTQLYLNAPGQESVRAVLEASAEETRSQQ